MILDDVIEHDFWTDGKNIFRRMSYCEHPTVIFKNLSNQQVIGGGVGCLNVNHLKPLTKENFDPEMIKKIKINFDSFKK